LKIRERAIGDVTIVDLAGKMLIGEGDDAIRNHVHELVGRGRTKVIFNMAEVPYMDSAGSGEIVRCFTTLARHGGRLKILTPTRKICDIWGIQKLITVFEIFDDVAAALASFGVDTFLSACPLCGIDVAFTTIGPSTQRCTSCSAEFVFAGDGAGGAREVDRIRLTTYDGESVSLRSGWPYELSLQGRLDVFAAEGLEDVWRVVPSPRRVLIDLGADCRRVSPRGLGALADLCLPGPDGGRTVAWLHDGAQDRAVAAGYSGPFFHNRAAALAALAMGDLQRTPITVEAARRA
jgi:anti-sigma B factor antagonist